MTFQDFEARWARHGDLHARLDMCLVCTAARTMVPKLIAVAKDAKVAVNQMICLGGEPTCGPCEDRERLAQSLARLDAEDA